jgi:predicted polyphosphate/ATP-dependent NAD kinase
VEVHEKEQPIRKTIGFIINPVAGMGGAVGLKGTDGAAILKEAIARGAKPIAAQRAETFLAQLDTVANRRNVTINLVVGAGIMGETEAQNHRFLFKTVGKPKKHTTPADTQYAAKVIVECGVDLLVYCGGDGTARDILRAVETKVPVLGVPTGVKMHSALFAVSPQAAARVVVAYLRCELPLRESEVMDINEDAFRQNRLSAELYGFLLSPFEPHLIQGNKMESPMTQDEVENQAAIAVYIIEEMQPCVLYIVAPGTTTRTVADLLDQKKTLLGVDLIQDKKIVARDVNETQIMQAIEGKKVHIIVTPIGGQGFIFGRGNQQISAKVIGKVGLDNITVIATKSKLDRLNSLLVDTGDVELDAKFRENGIMVVTDYKTKKRMSVE